MRRLIAVFAVCTTAWLAAFAMSYAPASAATTTSVMIDNFAFGPSSLTVHVGDTVVWTNHDVAPHDVTTTSAPVAIHSPTMTTGKSWQYTFTVAGQYRYICSIHPDMQASVTVLAAAPSPTPSHTAASPTSVSPPASVPVVAAPVRATHASRATAPSAARPSPAPTAPATTAAVVAAAQNTSPPGPTLKPMLWVAGAISAVAVFCLLVLAARPEAAE
jgi:plastocyanin